MIQDSTFYKNISREVVSLLPSNLVYPDDVILLCDTTTGAIIIDLLEIPANRWNTIYKLYIVDSGNNAAVNNITIKAPVGFLVNGQPSVTINTNGDTFLIRTVNDTNYLAISNYGTGGGVKVENQGALIANPATLMNFVGLQATITAPNEVQVNNAFITLTNGNLITAISGSNLISNQWYNVKDAQYGYFNFPFNVYIPAIKKNAVSNFGIGEFYDADYEAQGNYSSVAGFTSNLGIWNTGLITVMGSVVIWNNFHYVNITGLNGAIDPSLDVVNWKILSYSPTNGYILKYNEINYDLNNNRITYRKDENNNEVEWFDDGVTGSFDVFPFGNKKFVQNKVMCGAIWHCQNTTVLGSCFSNVFYGSELIFSSNTSNGFIINIFSLNYFSGRIKTMRWKDGSAQLLVTNNHFNDCAGISTLSNCQILDNHFQRSYFTATLSGDTLIELNNLIDSFLRINKSSGEFRLNNLQQSIFIVTSKTYERNNSVSHSKITIQFNEGIFDYNDVTQNSFVTINSISGSGEFVNNKIQVCTSINIETLTGTIGKGVKGNGNLFHNCVIDITTLKLSKSMFNNQFYDTQIDINDFSGSIIGCQMNDQSVIIIDDMANNNLVNLNGSEINLGVAGFVLPQSYVSGISTYGLSTVKGVLDCADPAIYDPITFTLLLPPTISRLVGVFVLTNANGIVIKKIASPNPNYPVTFFNDNGITTFQTTAVGVALGGDIVSSQVAPYSFNLQYRASGSDYIKLNVNGLLMEVIESGIFV